MYTKYCPTFKFAIILCLMFPTCIAAAQSVKPPIMGWSSWNHYHINIDENIIRAQADAMVSSGMAAAGYSFINIDDGFFGGRDTLTGKLYCHPVKFPSGMRMLSDYIRKKGLKPGIYSDAGANTCGSKYDRDPHGVGVGMYKNVENDARTFFEEWNYDFIKIDWCGGNWLKLNEQTEYTNIIKTIREIKKDARINVCRWEYPGEWVEKLADSWRISSDIRENFASIKKIIDQAADTYKYSSAGHYNDLDMLQVGRGMSRDEDITHFTMWCLMNSPLLAGNDLQKMSPQTVEILTNREVIALNQDEGFYQGRRLKIVATNGLEIWEKKLGKDLKGMAIVLYNPTANAITYTLKPAEINARPNASYRDLWTHQNKGKLADKGTFMVPKHGVVCIRIID